MREALLREIDALERVCSAMGAWLAQTGFDLDRRQIVELRRQLSTGIVDLCRVGDPFLASRSASDQAAFQERLSTLQAWSEADQAAWPEFRIEASRAAQYRRSAAVVQHATDNLLTFVRALAAT